MDDMEKIMANIAGIIKWDPYWRDQTLQIYRKNM